MSLGGIRRRMRRQPGGESGRHRCLGMGPSVRAAGTYGARLDGPHHGPGNDGCCKVGAPAQGLRGQSAQPSRPKYDSRSLRDSETDRGICQAATGGPPPSPRAIVTPQVWTVGLLFLGVEPPWGIVFLFQRKSNRPCASNHDYQWQVRNVSPGLNSRRCSPFCVVAWAFLPARGPERLAAFPPIPTPPPCPRCSGAAAS